MLQAEIVQRCARMGFNNRRLGKQGLAFVLGVFVFKQMYNQYRKRQCRQKISKKQKQMERRREILKERIADRDGNLLNPERERILSYDVTELVEKLRADELDPSLVLEAYQAKALVVNEKINAVCDFIFEATEWAQNLKSVPKDQRGPLYGLPISVKECFFVKGYDSTIGMAGFIDQPASEDGDIIKFIKDCHGIPFCLTNIPQTMVSYSCSNPVYGVTGNPHDLSRTPGGSSGGEGALIAAGASLLGLGSDIGGSLRIPAHFSGVVGLKPTSGRIYEAGRRGAQGSGGKSLRPCISSVAGYMSATVSGTRIGMQVLLENSRRMSYEDWRVTPLNWQADLYKPGRKLRIGWYDDNGYFPPTPGMKRAVRLVVEKLRADGHTVVEWKDRDHTDIYHVFIETMMSDRGYHSLKLWRGEILDQCIEALVIKYKTPKFLRGILSFLVGLLSKKTKKHMDVSPTLSRELYVTNASKDTLTGQFMAEWAENRFDVVICPGFAFPAPHHSYPSRLLPATSYTAIYNSLGNPVGMLPVTRETEEDQVALDSYPVQTDLVHRLAYKTTKGATGCPIGVQVVGRHYQEELVIHAMETIEKLVNYDRACAV